MEGPGAEVHATPLNCTASYFCDSAWQAYPTSLYSSFYWVFTIAEASICKQHTIPTTISYNNVPKLHQSTGLPCPVLSRTSGAKYSGVPQKVLVLSPFRIFERPKSVKMICPGDRGNACCECKSDPRQPCSLIRDGQTAGPTERATPKEKRLLPGRNHSQRTRLLRGSCFGNAPNNAIPSDTCNSR